jgi:hypothetical protein
MDEMEREPAASSSFWKEILCSSMVNDVAPKAVEQVMAVVVAACELKAWIIRMSPRNPSTVESESVFVFIKFPPVCFKDRHYPFVSPVLDLIQAECQVYASYSSDLSSRLNPLNIQLSIVSTLPILRRSWCL